MGKNKMMMFAAGIMFVGVIVMLVAAAPQSASAELTVTQYVEDIEKYEGEYVTVRGSLDVTSIEWDAENTILEFDIYDENGTEIHIIYEGLQPDTFSEGTICSVQGYPSEDDPNTIIAETLTTQCPSKYEGEDPTADPNA